MSKKKIICAKSAGFCFGVERAIRLAQRAVIESKGRAYTLGSLIHNPQEVLRLKKKGIVPINSLSKNTKGPIIIPSHGILPKGLNEIKKRGLKFIDTTCPFVLKAQRLARELLKEKYFVIVIGEKNHPEVKNIVGYTGNKAIAVEELKDLKKIPKNCKKIGVISQTTQTLETFTKIITFLILKYPELKINNTICQATKERQAEAGSIARRTNVMLVIGGRNSANTTHLAEICRQEGVAVYHIETRKEIRKSWFNKKKRIGITAGASTPDWVIKEVVGKVKEIIKK